MDAAGFRECLHVIGWTQRGFANLVKADSRQVRRWAAGDAVIPEHISEWLVCTSFSNCRIDQAASGCGSRLMP